MLGSNMSDTFHNLKFLPVSFHMWQFSHEGDPYSCSKHLKLATDTFGFAKDTKDRSPGQRDKVLACETALISVNLKPPASFSNNSIYSRGAAAQMHRPR